MKINKNYIVYFVLLSSMFALYIYRQNMRYYNKYHDLLRCEEELGEGVMGDESRVICESDSQVRVIARITSQPYQSRSKTIMAFDGIKGELLENIGLSIGDEVEVVGTLEKRLIHNSYEQIWLVGSAKSIVSSADKEGWFSVYKWRLFTYKLSEVIVKRLEVLYDAPHDGLIAGILIGKQSTLSSDFYNALIATGTIHIVAASGYNVSLIAALILRLFTRLFSKKLSIILALVGVFVFVLLAGGGPAVVRAGVMGSLSFLAIYSGRLNYSVYALFVTIVIMLLFKPTIVTSVSFLLSVSATLGILLLSPVFKKYINAKLSGGESFSKTKKFLSFMILDFSTTLAATLATLPVVLIYFDRVSLLSLLVNLLVLWVIPPMMMFGFLAWVGSFISFGLGRLFVYLSLPYLLYFTQVVEWFGTASFASAEVDWFNGYMSFGYYTLLFLIVLLNKHKRPMHE